MSTTTRYPSAAWCAGVVVVLVAASVAGSAAMGQDTVIFEERFGGAPDGASPKALGWSVHATREQSEWRISGGVLEVTCKHKPYNGGYIEKTLPVVRRGVLEFDANIGMARSGNARGLALTLDLYNISLWWHDYCRDWRRYFPEPVAKRMPGFSIEPVGHRSLGKVKKSKWLHYKVIFDTDRDLVEYYCADMVDPVYIDSGVPVLGRSEYQGGRVRIANLGYATAPVVYGLDNIVVRATPEAEASAEPLERSGLLVFQGMAMTPYRASDAVRVLGAKDARYYTIDFWRAAPYPKNMLKLGKMPSSATVSRARTIVLVDMPCGPGPVMPEFLVRQIAQSVHNGGALVVLGGLFTLGKGQFQGTLFEKMLPVVLGGKWEVRRADKPLTLRPTDPALGKGLSWSARPRVFYYHNLKVRPEADVLMRAGDVPILVRAPFGQGTVTVFTGTPCGQGTPERIGFWQWPDWPKLLARVIDVGAPATR